MSIMSLTLFILGAMTGSFINVCIYRMPRNLSIVTPRSHCPFCGKMIPWYDNIPIISFLLLGARCRFCKNRISLRYIGVELLSAFIPLILFRQFGLTPKFFISWYLSGALLIASFVDLEWREIPDPVTISGIIAGLIAAALYPPLMGEHKMLPSVLSSVSGILAGGGSIYAMGFLGEFIFKKEAMGGGDVKLLAMIGAFLGWKLVLFTFLLAPFFGSVAGIIIKIKRKESVIAYGPHLSLAAFVAILWGKEILGKIFLI